MLVLHFVPIGNNRLFPVVEAIVAFGVSETEEVVILAADTGAETPGFENGLGKDYLRIFDAVFFRAA